MMATGDPGHDPDEFDSQGVFCHVRMWWLNCIRKASRMSSVSIKGLNKAEVLAVLYNSSRPFGMGFVHYDPTPMTSEEAQKLLDERKPRCYFDYLNGRVMKVRLDNDDEFFPGLYDRDNGQGAAQRAVDSLRQTLRDAIQQQPVKKN